MAHKITFPTFVEIGHERAIIYDRKDGETLLKVDCRPRASIPCEAKFPDDTNQLVWIALLSPELLGPFCTTSDARRAEWIFNLSYKRAARLMQKLKPRINARLEALR